MHDSSSSGHSSASSADQFYIIFGTKLRKSAIKEYVCQTGKTPQGSNNFALFILVTFYLRHNFLKINESTT